MNKMRKFLATGMTRRAYDEDGHCVKVPVPGREEAAVGQNRAEFENFQLAEKIGLRCFPKAYSLTPDGVELIEELVDPVLSSALESSSESLLQQAGFDISRYKNIRGVKLISVVIIGIAYAVYKAYDVGIRMYDEFTDWCFSAESKREKVSFFVDFWLSDIFSLLKIVVGRDSGNSKLVMALISIIRFYFAKGGDFAIEDLWNSRQWGIAADGRLVAVDGGFSKTVQKSGHYGKSKIVPLRDVKRVTLPGAGDTEFNGEQLSEISDPAGNSVTYKFFTSKNTEYVLSAANATRRIKKAGLADDGLYQWTDKTVFVGYDTLADVMNVIGNNNDSKVPTKMCLEGDSVMTLSSINSDGEWEQVYSTNDISAVPEIGKHVLEFNFDGDGIVKSYHPGHDVSYIVKV